MLSFSFSHYLLKETQNRNLFNSRTEKGMNEFQKKSTHDSASSSSGSSSSSTSSLCRLYVKFDPIFIRRDQTKMIWLNLIGKQQKGCSKEMRPWYGYSIIQGTVLDHSESRIFLTHVLNQIFANRTKQSLVLFLVIPVEEIRIQ